MGRKDKYGRPKKSHRTLDENFQCPECDEIVGIKVSKDGFATITCRICKFTHVEPKMRLYKNVDYFGAFVDAIRSRIEMPLVS